VPTSVHPPLLELTAVHKRYGKTEALRGLHLCVHRGEVLALLGPNGAGKTTAVRALLGLTPADSGQIRVFGATPGAYAARLGQGVMLQVGALPDQLTVGEQLRLAASYYATPAALSTLVEDCELEGLLDRRYGLLSGGQKRRAQFALALIGNPRLLILDEPTAALDLSSRQSFWAAIKGRVAAGMGVLLTTHDLAEAEAVAHRVLLMAQGRALGSGTPAEVRARIDGSLVHFRTRLTLPDLAALEAAHRVQLDAGRASVHTRAPERFLRAALAADAQLTDLEVTRPRLEDAVDHWLKEAA
jgi:ABC-2 type transport system ATP-binding protein